MLTGAEQGPKGWCVVLQCKCCWLRRPKGFSRGNFPVEGSFYVVFHWLNYSRRPIELGFGLYYHVLD